MKMSVHVTAIRVELRTPSPANFGHRSGALVIDLHELKFGHGQEETSDTKHPHFDTSKDDPDDWTLFEQYLRTTRVNVNVRQVFPKGFNPVLDATIQE